MILEIFKDKLSDYIVIDIILKIWLGGLISLFVVGMVTLIYVIITGQADLQNATFGIFDTMGN